MKCFEENFLTRICAWGRNRDVLDVGCGGETRLGSIRSEFKSWTGIDPDIACLSKSSYGRSAPKARALAGMAENLPFAAMSFDVIVYALSYHHVPLRKMGQAISEAIRVLRQDGLIVILEPVPEGTFFEAELRFGCSDGDERRQLRAAYRAMKTSSLLREIVEFVDTVRLEYDSFQDFARHEYVRAGTEEDMRKFLSKHGYRLDERRRMNVFMPLAG